MLTLETYGMIGLYDIKGPGTKDDIDGALKGGWGV